MTHSNVSSTIFWKKSLFYYAIVGLLEIFLISGGSGLSGFGVVFISVGLLYLVIAAGLIAAAYCLWNLFAGNKAYMLPLGVHVAAVVITFIIMYKADLVL